jgi:arsenate reductase
MTARVLAELMMATSSFAQTPPQTILFVCEHGAAKSVVAAAHFNKRAMERGLPFRAISRGSAPDPAVPARITEGLAGEGLTMPASFAPALVTAGDVNAAARVVTFDVSLPVPHDRAMVTSWDGLPAFSDAYAPASAAIASKVDALLKELETATRKPPIISR